VYVSFLVPDFGGLLTIGKPLESALLGSLSIVHGWSLASQVTYGNGAMCMRIAEEREISLMAIDQYLRQVRWTAPLPDEEEARLMAYVERGKAEYVKSCPDEQVLADAKRARDRLVEGYQRLVMYLARRFLYYARRLELSDLIQEGNLGLMEAIERHDVRTGYRLSALAWRRVCQMERGLAMMEAVKQTLKRRCSKQVRGCCHLDNGR
jgi:DNA-directed RNA polymerase sigma subunit (sigma70/sigma32)